MTQLRENTHFYCKAAEQRREVILLTFSKFYPHIAKCVECKTFYLKANPSLRLTA